MKVTRNIIGILLALCLRMPVAAQEHLYFETFDVKRGLPESTVNHIAADKLGYIWMSTQRGLVRYDGYQYKSYPLDHPDNPINISNTSNLFIDSGHNIWTGTIDNGLYRYNYEADSFIRIAYPAGAAKGQYFICAEDAAGNLWGTINSEMNTNRMWKLDRKGKFEIFGNTEKGNNFIDASAIYVVQHSKNRTVWAATNNGLYRYEGPGKPMKGFMTSKTGQKSEWYTLYELPSVPGVFMGFESGGDLSKARLARFDTKSLKTNFHQLPSGALASGQSTDLSIPNFIYLLSSFYEDRKRNLWIATKQGLMKYDIQTSQYALYKSDDFESNGEHALYDITPSLTGELWISSSKGLVRFNPDTKRFQVYSRNDDIPGSINSDWIAAKFVDRENRIWLGHPWGGGSRSNKSKSAFEIKQFPSQIKGGIIGPVKDGYSLVAVEDGIYKFYITANTVEKIYNAGPDEKVDKQFAAAEGVWFTSAKGLGLLDPKTKKAVYVYNAEKTDLFGDLFVDSKGIVWLSVRGKGVYAFDPSTNKLTKYPFRKSREKITAANAGALDDESAIAIYEDKQGTIWIGTNWGGANRFDRKTGKFTSSVSKHNADMVCVDAMYEDSKCRFWVATYQNGVFEFDRKTNKWTRRVNEKSGLIFDGVHAITEDNSGWLWIISERGISKFDPKTNAVKNYPLITFTPGYDIEGWQITIPKFQNGKMLINLESAYALFDPTLLTGNTTPPIVNIEKIVVSDRDSKNQKSTDIIPYGRNQIELHYNQNHIRFDYIGLHFENSEENQYAYKLDGYDEDWVPAGTQRNVTYTNLPPGTYLFRVKASNSDGVWSDGKLSVKIVISPPWWKTWWAYILYAVVIIVAIWLFSGYRSKVLKRENQVLEERVADRTQQLTKSIDELKTTQAQLIQSEKMASLGELTAGIAHEIQNPLNFVNNFAEVSEELLHELDEKVIAGDKEEAIALSTDLKNNLQKIHHHGKRADSIVKSMLQHSRSTSGHKEPTDINALVDEYLRLAYHGLRAKDKSFNATIKTEFDADVDQVEIVPQDIGRVLLNLFTNAFYSVTHKKRNANAVNYEPTVTVTTRNTGKGVEVTVTDNGMGIPSLVIDKIMQPFFTTKPTGEGTGLGLSMSYDIIRAHNGTLTVESDELQFARFTIVLPYIIKA